MQDILQIVVQNFMRMKKVRLNPSCVFVHQNVSDVTAGEKNMEGRRRLQETLDETTKLAAEEEVYDAECFSDVIRFDVQNDVKYFDQLWEGNPPMAPPNPNYCENIQDLKKTIMSHAAKSHGMRLKDFKRSDHFKRFIRDEVSQFITDQFSVSVLPKMKKKDLSEIKHDYVEDFNLLEDVMRQELTYIMSDFSSSFNTKTFPVNLNNKDRPDEFLIDLFCQCCWVQCPFCGGHHRKP
ncbi:Interferon-induced very large GTPase 1 [Labeo rohita]|uniref:Interferon-induced very large GTPase 1 n=1 Tax=Labeo rohita TaxID=84645 RepID=A0ABQ8L9R3_LABRO|nr:Interferon-induced very large GTPase 1 [Labeo rohita]